MTQEQGQERVTKPVTLAEIKKAIKLLPFAEQLQLYRDIPQLIGRDPEDLDWQLLSLEAFFKDDPS